MVFNVVARAISGSTQFSWVSPIYTGGVHVVKLVFVYLLFISLLLKWVSATESRIIVEKLFFSPYISIRKDGQRMSDIDRHRSHDPTSVGIITTGWYWDDTE